MKYLKYFSFKEDKINKVETSRDILVNVTRYVISFVLILFVSQTIEIQINTNLLVLSSFLGLYLSKKSLKKGNYKKQIILNLFIIICLDLLFSLFSYTSSVISTDFSTSTWLNLPWLDLHPSILKDKFRFLSVIYMIFYIENLLFWKFYSSLTLEIISFSTLLVLSLSGHRNYKIDIPNTISSLTWKLDFLQRLNIDPEELLVGIGFCFSIISLIYIYLASSRTIYNKNSPTIRRGQTQLGLSVLSLGIIIVGFFTLTKVVLTNYSKELMQTTNGVGTSQGNTQGKSNLGFNKASTPSKQPAALLRLQNNYDLNPWKPMMYLREGALSDYDGKEIVKSSSTFDTDAPVVDANSPLLINPPINADSRLEINQAVYILSDKATPFSLDSPIIYKPIKNPNPKRFRSTYLVKSLTLTTPLNEILDNYVGEETWSKEVWEHYLSAPTKDQDIRYSELSKEITKDSSNFKDSITKIISYLSKESIYVLEPKHELPENGDPVAPYLFSEKKRGYCVHFAHAAVYLLRLSGVPARIGTGYLVDLQYAKGGDILVQMGDRHAWPEVYIRGVGWVVVDVTPEKAENDQVPVPDQNLLEELMNEIDPIEEISSDIVPKDLDNDKNLSPLEALFKSDVIKYIKYTFYIFITLFFITKLWIRHGFRLSKDPSTRVKRAFTAANSVSEDLLEKRQFGETLSEFSSRLEREKKLYLNEIVKSYLKVTYSTPNKDEFKIDQSIKKFNSSFKTKKDLLKLALSYLNPISILSYLEKKFKSIFLIIFIIFSLTSYLKAEVAVEEVLKEATQLFKEGKGIDARAKLENALTENKDDYRLFLLLGQYYLTEVSHFKLAYKYILQAKTLFEEKKLNLRESNYLTEDYGFSNQHALILYLMSEAELSLDRYEDSLKTLNQYGELYQSEWFPGQKAWVLMKLKRIKEAIVVSKEGLLNGADPKRTWNILGILLSVSGERELSLQAFSKAIEYEYKLSLNPQVATPINNAGEVYREIFKDDYAESAWKSALKFPDGCDHILPSVNLSLLYTDQLRLFAAERSLSDFEACYANKPEKKDSEHRTILALARAKINLLYNNISEADRLINISSSDQQWFGKIGTNENDIKFASWITASQIEKVKSELYLERAEEKIYNYFLNYIDSYKSKFKSYWLLRKAKLFSVSELEDFEDLSIRHSDTMITYPLLSDLLSSFGKHSSFLRLDRLLKEDSREGAKNYYNTYKAYIYFKTGDYDEAINLSNKILNEIPVHERLLKAELLSILIKSKLKNNFFSFRDLEIDNKDLIEDLFTLLPSHLRTKNIKLPINIELLGKNDSNQRRIIKLLTSRRFVFTTNPEKTRYKILISSNDSNTISLQFYDNKKNQLVVSEVLDNDKLKNISELVNEFNKKVFSYREDGEGKILPKISFIEKFFRN